jgi:hypothetical protein
MLMMTVPVRVTERVPVDVKVSVTGFVGMNVRFTTRLIGVIRVRMVVRVAMVMSRNPAVAMMMPALMASITPPQHVSS